MRGIEIRSSSPRRLSFYSVSFTAHIEALLFLLYFIRVFVEASPPTLNICVLCTVSFRVSLFSVSFHALYFSVRPIYFFISVFSLSLFFFFLSLLLYLLWHEDHHVPQFIDLAPLWLNHSSCWCVGFNCSGEGGAITFHGGKIFLALSIVINGGVLWIAECHKYLVDLFFVWRKRFLRYWMTFLHDPRLHSYRIPNFCVPLKTPAVCT